MNPDSLWDPGGSLARISRRPEETHPRSEIPEPKRQFRHAVTDMLIGQRKRLVGHRSQVVGVHLAFCRTLRVRHRAGRDQARKPLSNVCARNRGCLHSLVRTPFSFLRNLTFWSDRFRFLLTESWRTLTESLASGFPREPIRFSVKSPACACVSVPGVVPSRGERNSTRMRFHSVRRSGGREGNRTRLRVLSR